MKCLILILSLASFGLYANKVDTNQSAALVYTDSQTQWEYQQQGLISVLSMKSGLNRSDIEKRFDVNQSFRDAILRSYFEKLPIEFGSNQQWFNLTVDEAKLQQLMLEQRIPIWPDRRGQLYVWLVEEKPDEALHHASSDSAASYWLRRWFNVLGIPTIFYDATSEDLLSFEPKDVSFQNPDLIDYVLAKQDVVMALLVFVKDTGNGYSYRYGLAKQDEQTQIKNLKFIDLSSGMMTLASNIQETMAKDQRLFAEEFNDSTVALTINDITSPNQMLGLLGYFENHALIDKFQVNQFKGAQMKIMANIKVLPDTFVQFVENEGMIRHQPLGIGSEILFKMLP